MKRFSILAALAMIMVGCSQFEEPELPATEPAKGQTEFFASINDGQKEN